MRFITSFGDSGYDLYGEKFLKSYIKHWDAPLNVYYEEKRSFPKSKKISYRSLWDVPNVKDYLDRPRPSLHKHTRDFRFQIYKFCRKSFVQIEEIKQGGEVFWLDADVLAKSKADINKIKKTVKDVCIAYMGREGYHPCTSFVGFNASHPDMPRFLSMYEDVYLSEKVFDIPEWHDAYVFNYVRKESKVKCRNIAEHIKGQKPHFNVFNYCFPFAVHKKGNLK